MLQAVSFQQISQILELTDGLGISREWVEISLGPESPGKVRKLANGKLEIVVDAVVEMLERQAFGLAGKRVVIEECLQGEELTLMAFADGKTIIPMIAAQDHKRVGDGDTGPNTGGMGAYAPAPIATAGLRDRIVREVLYPAIEGLTRVGSPFYGVLYAGIMVKDGDPYVLEFNARFGDPETQVVLPLLKTDLVNVLEAVIEHRLDQLQIEWHERAAVCVALTSGGYPGAYQKGLPITGCTDDRFSNDVMVFHAGTAWKDNNLVTAGGRVLGATGLGPDISAARSRAYEAANAITFDGVHFRRDIASRVAPLLD